MKKLIISALVTLGITSCSKDSLDPGILHQNSIDKSEIFISVSFLDWTDKQCEPGSIVSGSQMVYALPDARVLLFTGNASESDMTADPLRIGITDKNGSAIFEGVDPGHYTLLVDSPQGQKSRSIHAQRNLRTSVDFSF